MQQKNLSRQIMKSALIFVAAVIVIVLITSGFGAIGIPLWPFIFFLFFYTSVDNFNPQKLKGTALGGMIGIFVGMSQGIVSQLSGNTTVGFAAFALFALILGTAFIMGNVAWANVFGLLLMTLLTLFPLNPCVWAALPARTTLGWTECFLRVMASYLIAVVLFVLVSAIMRKKNQK